MRATTRLRMSSLVALISLVVAGGAVVAAPAPAHRGATPVTVAGLPVAATAGRGADVPFLEYEAETSRYGWFYGSYPFTNDPADGTPHHFYDEARLLLDRAPPAGTRVRLQVCGPDRAPWYVVDLADFELVGSPLAAPAGALDVTGFGADPSGVAESAGAFDAAIAAGRGLAASGNWAEGKPVDAPGTLPGFLPQWITDANPMTYWESVNGEFPQTVTVDLGAQIIADRVVLKLPPVADWGQRTQTIEILTSTDGATFTTVVPATGLHFDAATGNQVAVDLPDPAASQIRLVISGNTGWPAAQLAELEVYAPGPSNPTDADERSQT